MVTEKPKKEFLGLWITPKGREWLDELAHDHRVSRSEVGRQALIVAKKYQRELEQRLEEAQ